MKKLGELFDRGHSMPKSPGDSKILCNSNRHIGVEIEIEGRTPGVDFEHWRIEPDGSLRGGYELISNILVGYSFDKAIEEVSKVVKEANINWRCGVHVHVDVSDYTPSQLRSLAVAYALIEPLLFAWEGNDRDKSRFCLPWANAMSSVSSIVKATTTESRQQIHKSFYEAGKYLACNFIPIVDQGSAEFRHMETPNDVGRIVEYANICMSIVEAAKSVEGVSLLRAISGSTVDEFLQAFYGDATRHLATVPNANMHIWQGVALANTIEAYTKDTPKVPHKKTARVSSLKLKRRKA